LQSLKFIDSSLKNKFAGKILKISGRAAAAASKRQIQKTLAQNLAKHLNFEF
jgi:hypothetical protein